MSRQCKAIRKDGNPCTSFAGDDGFCWFHSPALEGDRRDAQVAGGKNKSNSARMEKLLPEVLKASITLTMQAMKDTASGKMEPARARAVAACADVVIRAYESGTAHIELQQLEQTIFGTDYEQAI